MEIADTTKIIKCEVCDQTQLNLAFSLGEQPLCDDLKLIGSKAQAASYPINVLLCSNCLTAHQEYQVKPEVLFHPDYHYRAKLTKDVLNGMSDLVQNLKQVKGDLNGVSVLDIGCNDGSLLDLFYAEGAKTFGIEPTQAMRDCSNEHSVINAFFNYETAKAFKSNFGSPDIICFTNVFAHISDLNSLIRNLRLLIDDQTLVVIENHYLGSVVNAFQFDTFYHEHPRTYSLRSFAHIAKKLDMAIVEHSFPKRYGGNIRVILGGSGDASKAWEQALIGDLSKEQATIEQLNLFGQKLEIWKEEFKAKLAKWQSSGLKVAGKAFPGRASIIINALDLSEKDIPVIFEQVNSPKVGHYVPGTSIEIVVEEELNEYDILVNFAWHINTEITQHLRKTGFKGEVVPVI